MTNIALAQIQPINGDVAANTTLHLRWIRQAATARADAIFFPELSLTGYEPTLAEKLAMDPADEQLKVFQHASDEHQLTIGLGLPIRSSAGIHISMAIFQPRQTALFYHKQQLHVDEEPFFVPGSKQLLIVVKGIAIAPAICFESLQPSHAAHTKALGADLYLASVAKPQRGISTAFEHYPRIASTHRMPVLLINAVGPCDDFVSAGQSAGWSADGKLQKNLNSSTPGMLICHLSEQTEVIEITAFHSHIE